MWKRVARIERHRRICWAVVVVCGLVLVVELERTVAGRADGLAWVASLAGLLGSGAYLRWTRAACVSCGSRS